MPCRAVCMLCYQNYIACPVDDRLATRSSGSDQRKEQSSASLAFVRGIYWSPVNSSHKGPVTRKMFPFDDVIMNVSQYVTIQYHSVFSDKHPDSDISSSSDALTHWDRDKMDATSQTTFSNGFSWMTMYEFRLTFHWSLFLGVQLTIFQHWFR